jgi:hypothetical protein
MSCIDTRQGHGEPPHGDRCAQPQAPGCTIVDSCDQCGRRMPQAHLSGDRAYCSRCCPACAAMSASRAGYRKTL